MLLRHVLLSKPAPHTHASKVTSCCAKWAEARAAKLTRKTREGEEGEEEEGEGEGEGGAAGGEEEAGQPSAAKKLKAAQATPH
eukprot:3687262-Rhodomonas_salina.1